MKQIFVNLKRFEVPRRLGGVCPVEDPIAWITGVMESTWSSGWQGAATWRSPTSCPNHCWRPRRERCARARPRASPPALGVQGVHWADIAPGQNFGAFTSLTPATSARHLGAEWSMVGHSEERRAKLQTISAYDSSPDQVRAASAVDRQVQAEAACALAARLKVLLCVGETAEQRGEGEPAEQQQRVREVLRTQVTGNLSGSEAALADGRVVIAYEPVWAIGPGKTPPGGEYIAFVSACIKQVVREQFGHDVPVVYGGGLKEENAAMLAGIGTIDGGLIALTRFTGEIGFDVPGLAGIMRRYLEPGP